MIDTVEKIYNLSGNFDNYKITLSSGETKSVPLDEANTDYQEVQQWIADGGTVIDNGGTE